VVGSTIQFRIWTDGKDVALDDVVLRQVTG